MITSDFSKSKVILDDAQQDMLAGKEGDVVAKCLKTMVDLGEVLGATKMVPISFSHITGTFAMSAFHGYYELLDRLVDAGCKVKVPTTCNPHPGREFSFENRSFYRPQIHHEHCLKKLGVIQNYSCVAYYDENTPPLGAIGGAGESSVVVYMNSMLGARTNIWGVLTDFYQAISGYTPLFGLLLDENRKGEVLIDISELKDPNPDALGLYIGYKAIDRTPVVTHHPFDKWQMKQLLATANSSGAARLIHVEGVTPEAPDLQTAFQGGKPTETFKPTQADLDALMASKEVRDETDVVVFGCPQMTCHEALQRAPAFVGKQVKKRTIFSMVPLELERLKNFPEYEQLQLAGVEFAPACPLTYLTMRNDGLKNVLTDSGKLHYYVSGAQFADAKDCYQISTGD